MKKDILHHAKNGRKTKLEKNQLELWLLDFYYHYPTNHKSFWEISLITRCSDKYVSKKFNMFAHMGMPDSNTKPIKENWYHKRDRQRRNERTIREYKKIEVILEQLGNVKRRKTNY